MKNLFLLLALFLVISLKISLAQSGEIIPFDSEKWTIDSESYELENYLGKPALHLKKEGNAYLKDADFLNGIIEFEIAFPNERNFIGLMFRMQDINNYEDFYVRPHQSGNPDANQYTPNFNGVAAWQLYAGDGYAQAISYPYNEWISVKCVVSDTRAEIYIGALKTPTLYIPFLKGEMKNGMLGVWGRLGYFANFRYTKMDKITLVNEPKTDVQMEAGTVKSWNISNTFPEKNLQEIFTISDQQKSNLTWNKLSAENSGTTNIARIAKIEEDKNTVFSKLIIQSNKAQIKQFSFGYSDRVRIYLNDKILYAGNNQFRSRDYRYLGTIGYFDEIFLPLQKGENELWIAVSESFGGWGIQGKLMDETGVIIK